MTLASMDFIAEKVKQRFLLTFKNSEYIVQSKRGIGTVITMIIDNKEALEDV